MLLWAQYTEDSISGMQIQTQDEYELFCHGRLDNPFPLYHRLRAEDPVHWSEPMQGWVVTRYDDVHAAFLDPRLSSQRVPVYMQQIPEPIRSRVKPLGEHFSNWLGMTDPPVHTRLRTLIGKALTPRVIRDARPRIQEIVDELLDNVAQRGEMDIENDFSFPLPSTVICEMLGIPTQDHVRFREQAEGIQHFLGGAPLAMGRTAEFSQQSMFELRDYFRGLIDERRRNPRPDLISSMVSVEEQGDRFTEEEVTAMSIFLFFAGFETTKTMLTNGMLALFENPGELQRLKADPSLTPTAVEEFLRYYSPLQRQIRVPMEDIEIRGRSIRKGQPILLMQGAANRDPEQFPDPDRLDVGREPNKHVAFGLALHFCLGAPLARLEGEVAFETILRRFPNIRMAVAHEELEWLENMTFLSLKSLPAVF